METEIKESTDKFVVSKKALFILVAIFFAFCLTVGGFLFWKTSRHHSLLPLTVTKQITDFTPFFFFEKIPGGYTLDERAISHNQGVVILPLTKDGMPSIVLTEQTLPESLSQDLLTGEGTHKVEGTAAPAIINNVEGRLVGIMTSKQHNLLLLINASANARSEDIVTLLQGLRPTK